MSESRWMSVDARGAVHVSDIQDRDGAIPSAFQDCIACKRPAVYILCAVSNDTIAGQELRYSDSSAEALAQELRAEFHTSVEFPVCELHFDGCAPQ
jgi:hypothetical protein